MEFCIPWKNLIVDDVQYGLSQVNTRIQGGLFIPIYYADKNVKCQAVHLLTPPLKIIGLDPNKNGTFLVVRIDKDIEFGSKLLDFDTHNLNHATRNQHNWWNQEKQISYKTALTKYDNGDIDWRIQVPDSGVYSAFDWVRKSWYASNESGLGDRQPKILARTSGIWVDSNSFGMDWKLIGAYFV
jgi:hypothetical protein